MAQLLLLVLLLATVQTAAFAGTSFVQHNLVSDTPGLADQTDPNLINPWGIAASATSPLWISNNRSGATTVYNGSGQPFPAANPLVVQIPTSSSGNPPSAPTGQVFNPTSAFMLSGGQPALFLFASEDGTISGWNSSAGASGRPMIHSIYTYLSALLGVTDAFNSRVGNRLAPRSQADKMNMPLVWTKKTQPNARVAQCATVVEINNL